MSNKEKEKRKPVLTLDDSSIYLTTDQVIEKFKKKKLEEENNLNKNEIDIKS